jgi:hypothetical protein
VETQPFIELLSNMKKKKKVYILDPDRFYKAKSGTHSFVKVFRRKKEETHCLSSAQTLRLEEGEGTEGNQSTRDDTASRGRDVAGAGSDNSGNGRLDLDVGGLRAVRAVATLRLLGLGRGRGVGRRSSRASGLRHGLGDGARAVGDGDGARLSDVDGLVAVDDVGGVRAVGGVRLDDLSGVDGVLGLSRAGGGGDEAALLEGVEAEALGVHGSAVGHVGVSGGAARVVLITALLGAGILRRSDGGGGGVDGVSEGAGAVGDGQGGGLGDGVGLVTVGEGGRTGAVGGESLNDLGGGDGGTVASVRDSLDSGGHEGTDSDETSSHFDSWLGCDERKWVVDV